jgi:L-serine dehydratase
MQACVDKGCKTTGVMPGLKVKRRAAALYEQLASHPEAALRDPLTIMDWVNLYALAVNEENAVGGRVVTAPTNGAAGIIPAVLHYYVRFCGGANDDGVVRFLLTAGAVGLLFKRNGQLVAPKLGVRERSAQLVRWQQLD